MGSNKAFGSKLINEPPSDEWTTCSLQSIRPIAQLFVAFKTPLSTKIQVQPEYRFTPKSFLNSFKIQGASIQLWIDTTCENNSYDVEEVLKEGTTYVRLDCNGEEAEDLIKPPSKKLVEKFNTICKDFIKSRKLSQYIGVHCSLGYNLSGYLICSFLIEHVGYTLEGALAEFSKCRPNGIFNQNLINGLYQKFGNVTDFIVVPFVPLKIKSAVDQGNKKEAHEPKFVDGVKGVKPVHDPGELTELQKRVQNTCKWTRGGFPGRTVVTLNSENISLLKEREYLICHKADGRRYMMFIQGQNDVYFVDRENYFFRVSQNFEFLGKNGQHLKDTLIDGEIIVDLNGKTLFIMFDIVSFNGECVMKIPFMERFNFINEIIAHANAQQKNDNGKISGEKIQIVAEKLHPVSEIRTLMNDQPNLSFKTDGFIFSPIDHPYQCGSCDTILKWKPHELNTVDFLVRIENNKIGDKIVKIGKLYVGRLDTPLGQIELNSDLEKLDGEIIECVYENSKWKFLRHRTERVSPNYYNTAMEVITSILDPVGKEALLKFIDQI